MKPNQFTLTQILESIFWIAIGIWMVKVIADYGQEAWFNNTALLFTMVIPGLAFGAAVGVLWGRRVEGAVTGFALWLIILWLWGPGGQ